MVLRLPNGQLKGRVLEGVGHHVNVAFSGGNRNYFVLDDENFLKDFTGGSTLFVVTDGLKGQSVLDNLVSRFGGSDYEIIYLPSGEEAKDIRAVEALKREVLARFDRPPETVFAVGGGVVIDATNALIPILSLGRENIDWIDRPIIGKDRVATRNYVVVPTTILAASDVAYGSKGNLNDGTHKHAFKLYFDPDAIFLDPAFMAKLPAAEIKCGLAECLKHALLQDCGFPVSAPSLVQIEHLFCDAQPDPLVAFIVACQTMYAKAQMLGRDLKESTWKGIYLSYGHLHAHAHEEATNFRLKHGDAVLFGMLVDLKLCGNEKLYRRILSLVPHTRLAEMRSILDIDKEKLRAIYNHEPKKFFRTQDDEFKVVDLKFPGQFATDPREPESIRTFTWDQISAALDLVRVDMDQVCTRTLGLQPLRKLVQRIKDMRLAA